MGRAERDVEVAESNGIAEANVPDVGAADTTEVVAGNLNSGGGGLRLMDTGCSMALARGQLPSGGGEAVEARGC